MQAAFDVLFMLLQKCKVTLFLARQLGLAYTTQFCTFKKTTEYYNTIYRCWWSQSE